MLFYDGRILNEEDLTADERKALDDSDFAIPELRKFPVHDAEHVRSAVAYFGRHCPKKYRRSCARRILAAAREHGVEVSEDSDVAEAARER